MAHQNRTLLRLLQLTLLALIVWGGSVSSTPQHSTSDASRIFFIGSKLSLAAIGRASGAPASAVANLQAEVMDAADSLGLEVPPIPALDSQTQSPVVQMVNYILSDMGSPVADQVRDHYGVEHASLFELAVRSNLLLVLYKPDDETSAAVARAIERSGITADVPAKIWAPTVALVTQGASYEQVRGAVVSMHRHTALHLSELKH